MLSVHRNPFPDYPVTRLQDRTVPAGPTIETAQIQQARDLVKEYVRYWAQPKPSDGNPRPLFISVRGDYGAGKTFLLLDAMTALRKQSSGLEPTVLRFSCLEADVVTWYRTGIGPALEAAPLARMMTHVYARAGEQVAGRARLTEAAVEKLQKDPAHINSLLTDNLLNRTAVDQMLFQILGKDCDITQEDVAKAFAGLVWDQTAGVATRWLTGSALSVTELDPLRISAPLTSEAAATATLTALASIHTFLKWPCALFIDELEHLVRYDISDGRRRNITWLKRLLEGLSRSGVLVLIAGHWEGWEAWEAKTDSPGRLSPQQPIRLWKLAADDIAKIVRAWVAGSVPPVFDATEAQAVVELTDGNLRRVLSLLRILFDATNGFQNPLGVEQMKSLAERTGQKISLEDAKLSLHEILERRGLQVQAPAKVLGIEFGLAGYEAGKPAILADFTHATLQEQQRAHYFLSRVLSAQSHYPGVLGFFVVDGNIDQQALAFLNNPEVRIVVFDLTQGEVLTQLAAEVDRRFLTGGRASDIGQTIEDLTARQESLLEQIQAAQKARDSDLAHALAAEREAIQNQLVKVEEVYGQLTRSVEQRVSAIERQRQGEAREFQERLEELTRVLKSERDKSIIGPVVQAPTQETPDNKIHVTYADLTRPPTGWARLASAARPTILLLLAQSLLMPVLAYTVGTFFFFNSSFLVTRIAIALSIAGFIVAVLLLLQGLQHLNRYYDFSARMLRELYVRSGSAEELLMADHILRDTLEEAGPVWGKRRAVEALASRFPVFKPFIFEGGRFR